MMLNFYFTPKHSFAPTKSAAVLFQVWGDLGVGCMGSEGKETVYLDPHLPR